MKKLKEVICALLVIAAAASWMVFPTNAAQEKAYTHVSGGAFQGVPEEYRQTMQYLSRIDYLEASNTPNDAYPQGQPTARDACYGTTEELIVFGEDDTMFFQGLGVHPKAPNRPIQGSIESWTIYDVRNLCADRFYSAVGITNPNGKEGKSKGVIFRVYGDYAGQGEYVLLAESEAITMKMAGEFDVDITGVQYLKLVVVAASTTNTSSASAWGNACVYATKENEPMVPVTTAPSEETVPTEEAPTQPTVTEPAPTQPAPADVAASPWAHILGLVIVGLAAAAAGAAIAIFRKESGK